MSFRPDGRRQADDDMELNATRLRALDLQCDPIGDETSFSDLPDEMLIKVFKYLGVPTRFNLRINKRLERRHLCVKNNMKKIVLNIYHEPFLQITPSNRRSHFHSYDFDDFDGLVNGLNRLAVNTKFRSIGMNMYGPSYKQHDGRIIDAFSNFEADELWIKSMGWETWNLQQLNVTTLFAFAKNVREVGIDVFTSITAKDLCTLRETMLEGNCKLEFFSIQLDSSDDFHEFDEFMKECFGVTIVYPNREHERIYRAPDESIEFYGYIDHINNSVEELHHYEGDLMTEVGHEKIVLRKCKGGAKPESDLEKIIMNHSYSIW